MGIPSLFSRDPWMGLRSSVPDPIALLGLPAAALNAFFSAALSGPTKSLWTSLI